MQITVDIDDRIYDELGELLAAGHGLSVEEYVLGHLTAYWHGFLRKEEGRGQYQELKLAAHYVYHEMLGSQVISEEEYP